MEDKNTTENSPKGLQIELGTQHPRHCQLLRTAKGRAPRAWTHWTNRNVLGGVSRKEVKGDPDLTCSPPE